MILSMTGYGKGQASKGDISYQVEIKSLNSKSTDIRCKLPEGFMQQEILIRQIITDRVIRGRIEVVVSDTSLGDMDQIVNTALIKAYYKKIHAIALELNADTSQLMSSIIRLSDISNSAVVSIDEAHWAIVEEALLDAIQNLNSFRITEGKVLGQDLIMRAQNIQQLLPHIEKYEGPRIDRLRERLKRNIEEYLHKDRIDNNRFEQEMLYYLEKLDITEEKIRLDQHCKYFVEQVSNDAQDSGKVLSFIAQEMGREINTLGSKAQDSDLQQIVVSMKDELEKIKEQIANIL